MYDKHRTITDSHNGNDNKQKVNNNRTIALERTAALGTGGGDFTGTKSSPLGMLVRKDAKIRNRYNQVPHLTQDTNGKVTNSQLDTPNESQEVNPFPAGDNKAHINRRALRHSKHKREKT